MSYLTQEKRKEYLREYNRKYRKTNREIVNERQRIRRDSERNEVVRKLGNRCVICGLDDVRVLQVDHVNGGGEKERRTKRTSQMYKEVLAGVRSDLQLLCANCNWIKRHESGFFLFMTIESSRSVLSIVYLVNLPTNLSVIISAVRIDLMPLLYYVLVPYQVSFPL